MNYYFVLIAIIIASFLTIIFVSQLNEFLKKSRIRKLMYSMENLNMSLPKEKTSDHFWKFAKKLSKMDTSSVKENEDFVKSSFQVLDMRKIKPDELFRLHRFLGRTSKLDPLIKMTVHWNLFTRAIKCFGNETQNQLLTHMQSNNLLGGFALTEKNSGVLSGMIVETICIFDETSNTFNLFTPHPDNKKYWISGGESADYLIIYATLYLSDQHFKEKKSSGIHPFVVQVKSSLYKREKIKSIDEDCKNLSNSISNTIYYEDVPEKNLLKGVDNVNIFFQNVKLSRSTHLDKRCTLEDLKKGSDPPSFLKMMNSLLSGRLCIADGCLEYLKLAYRNIYKYLYEERKIYISSNLEQIHLGELSHIKKFMQKVKFDIIKMEKYLQNVQAIFCQLEEQEKEFTYDFVTRINICKVYIPIKLLDYGRKMNDFIGAKTFDINNLCVGMEKCFAGQVAEGDSRLLAIKLAIDQLKHGSFLSGLTYEQIYLKYDLLKSGQTQWYIQNTDRLLKMGMKIAKNEIRQFSH